jgi:hypothetical protein
MHTFATAKGAHIVGLADIVCAMGETMKIKINMKELLHYIIGGTILIFSWQPLMILFNNNTTYTGIAWILWYIILDQILHVVIKGEKIAIVK